MKAPQYDLIVLGAGIAGLGAARVLAQAGRQVLVLEAQGRVGGRMHSHHAAGLSQPVELGAEFIHGRPPELLALLGEAKLDIVETEGDQLCYAGGAIAKCPGDGAWALLEGMESVADEAGDMGFDAYLARSSGSAESKRRARGYVEGFNAADASEIGIAGLARQQAAEDAIEGSRAARVMPGYQALAEYVRDRAVEAGATLLLDTPVAEIAWQPCACTVHAAGARQWSAKQIICALPLGVLQTGSVSFTPRPDKTLRAAMSLRPGLVQRLVLQFRERWWAAEYPRMHFLFAPEMHPPTWWTTLPLQGPLLTAWTGGPRARDGSSDLVTQSVHALEQMFARPLQGALAATHHVDWNTDPYTRGAYSYAPAGAADASCILSQPVEHTLFFAGEHTDTTGHPGTVHGALRSGLRAAQQALTASRASNQP